MMKTIKAAIIGCGGRAPAHLEADVLVPGVKIAACCAPSATRRAPLARRFGLREYDDAARMIREEKPDLVHLVTWPETRVSLMTLVSDLGVPFCTVEKPLANTPRDWKALRSLASRTRTRFAISHQCRWNERLVPVQRHVREGAAGEIRLLELSCGMNLMGQGTHILNYSRSLVGDPLVEEVFGIAHGWDAADPKHGAPAQSVAQLRFAGGLRGLWTSGASSPRAGDPKTTWQHVRVAAWGDRGHALWEEFGASERVGEGIRETEAFPGMEAFGPANVRAQAAFHKSLLESAEPGATRCGTDLEASLHECAVIFALYQSSLTHKPVALSGFEPEDDLVDRMKR